MQEQRAIGHARQIEARCEDAIIEVGAITEGDLLKYLANIYQTRFVTTPKLAKVSVPRSLLRLIPRKLADTMLIFPILYDEGKNAISVVAAAPGEYDVAKQVQMVSKVRNVAVYVARPATIRALIQKHYDGNRRAFDELAARFPAMGRSLSLGHNYSAAEFGGAGDPMTALSSGAEPGKLRSRRPRQSPTANYGISVPDLTPVKPREAAPTPKPKMSPLSIAAPDAPSAAAPLAPPLAPLAPEPAAAVVASVPYPSYLHTLNVLVALLEQSRAELRGHSAQVARLAQQISQSMGLSEQESFGITVAAQIHDIGKGASYHLTPLNVAQYEGHRIQAQKTYQTPLRFFESVQLSKTTIAALTHLYERPDGKGFPDKLSGKDVPMAARILAMVETYCDLTAHAKNPYRKILEPKEAVGALDKYRDQFFDGDLIDLLKRVVLGEDLKNKLLSDRPTVLIVDPDPEETAVLELRFVEHGFAVEITRSALDAYERVQKGGIDAVVGEVELEPIDGFELLLRIRQGGVGSNVPFLFVTRRGDREAVNRGFESGAADYLVKPASGDVVAAKTRQVLAAGQKSRGPGRGVSGSLSEMGLPDVVQILSNGRKSGQLAISSDTQEGRILFNEGMIWDAVYGELRGEDAFYAMLLLVDGDFTLDPSVKAGQRVIDKSSEGLLLEGMRRFDEGAR